MAEPRRAGKATISITIVRFFRARVRVSPARTGLDGSTIRIAFILANPSRTKAAALVRLGKSRTCQSHLSRRSRSGLASPVMNQDLPSSFAFSSRSLAKGESGSIGLSRIALCGGALDAKIAFRSGRCPSLPRPSWPRPSPNGREPP